MAGQIFTTEQNELIKIMEEKNIPVAIMQLYESDAKRVICDYTFNLTCEEEIKKSLATFPHEDSCCVSCDIDTENFVQFFADHIINEYKNK